MPYSAFMTTTLEATGLGGMTGRLSAVRQVRRCSVLSSGVLCSTPLLHGVLDLLGAIARTHVEQQRRSREVKAPSPVCVMVTTPLPSGALTAVTVEAAQWYSVRSRRLDRPREVPGVKSLRDSAPG